MSDAFMNASRYMPVASLPTRSKSASARFVPFEERKSMKSMPNSMKPMPNSMKPMSNSMKTMSSKAKSAPKMSTSSTKKSKKMSKQNKTKSISSTSVSRKLGSPMKSTKKSMMSKKSTMPPFPSAAEIAAMPSTKHMPGPFRATNPSSASRKMKNLSDSNINSGPSPQYSQNYYEGQGVSGFFKNQLIRIGGSTAGGSGISSVLSYF